MRGSTTVCVLLAACVYANADDCKPCKAGLKCCPDLSGDLGPCYNQTTHQCCQSDHVELCNIATQHCEMGECAPGKLLTCTATNPGNCEKGQACCLAPGRWNEVKACYWPETQTCCPHMDRWEHQSIGLCNATQVCDSKCGCLNPGEKCCVGSQLVAKAYNPKTQTCCTEFPSSPVCNGANMTCCPTCQGMMGSTCCAPGTQCLRNGNSCCSKQQQLF